MERWGIDTHTRLLSRHRNNEILTFLTIPVEPSHRLSERSQAQKDERCMFSRVWDLKKKIAEVEGAAEKTKRLGRVEEGKRGRGEA